MSTVYILLWVCVNLYSESVYSVYNVHDTTSLNSEYNRHINESVTSECHDLIFPGTHLKI